MLSVRSPFRASTFSTVFSPFDEDNTHTCNLCSRSFSRAEHLERHLTVHMPTTTSRTFVCTYCTKGFTRKDVLTRHIRAVHETKRAEQRKSRRKSCNRCARFKIKCSGGSRGLEASPNFREPCDACKKRGLCCAYDFSIPQEETNSQSPTASSTSLHSGSAPSSPERDYESWKRRRLEPEFSPGMANTTDRLQGFYLESERIPDLRRHHHSISYISIGPNDGYADLQRYKTDAKDHRELGISTPESSPVSQQINFGQRPPNPIHTTKLSVSSICSPLPPPTPTSPHHGHIDLKNYKSTPAWQAPVMPKVPENGQWLKLPPLRQVLDMEAR